MAILIGGDTISEAWVRTLAHVHASRGGRAVHVATAVADAGAEVLEVRDALDKLLLNRGSQSIDTVAETIFPSSLYNDPGFDWHVGLPEAEVRALDAAAAALYADYIDLLPMLRTVRANKSGTYFSRMVTWPGKEAGGTNQIALRVERLRSEATLGRRTNNTLDVDVAADALEPVRGLQVYAATDRRLRSFPCLTHIDFTLHEGVLHCTAVYRHQYLIEKAYGNLVGLGALMRFLCQQGGCRLGELAVHATMADAQPGFGAAIDDLLGESSAALDRSMGQ